MTATPTPAAPTPAPAKPGPEKPGAEKRRPATVVEAEHLSLVGPEGPVFTDVSLAVEPGRLTVVVGPGGSGRSSLVLALTGRMRGGTGVLRTQGRPVRSGRELRALRGRTAVARVAAFAQPEPRLTVAESVVERALLDGVRPAAAERAFAVAEDRLDVHLDRDTLVERLTAYERTALAVLLALVRPADLVVLDDLDADLDLDDQRRLADALVRLAGAAGCAVLATSTERASVPADAVLVTLAPPQKVA
ncbi:ATP-binding cassette domain-containing protein [Microlunatus antarcticus]